MRGLVLAAAAAVGTMSAAQVTSAALVLQPEYTVLYDEALDGDIPDDGSWTFALSGTGDYAIRGTVSLGDVDKLFITYSAAETTIRALSAGGEYGVRVSDFRRIDNSFITLTMDAWRDSEEDPEWVLYIDAPTPFAPVPLPATAPMVLTGAAGLIALTRKRRS